MHEAVTMMSRSSHGTTNDYGPNKGPRVGDNDITESTVSNVTDATTTEWSLPDSYTDHMSVDFHVKQALPTTTNSVEFTETTTLDDNNGITTNGPNPTSDYDESTTPTTAFTIDSNANENSTAIPDVASMGIGKTVLPMQCNNVNDCTSNERCINNKCTKICDTTNSNRSSVDCIQGICK